MDETDSGSLWYSGAVTLDSVTKMVDTQLYKILIFNEFHT
jgi:hypothetical protein